MAAGKHNIRIEQGADFFLKLTLEDSEGAPIDLTNHVFEGQIRKTATDEELLGEFEFDVQNQSIEGETGVVHVSMTAGSTDLIPVKKNSKPDFLETSYVYSIQSTIVGGTTERWLEGEVTVSPSVTRDE